MIKETTDKEQRDKHVSQYIEHIDEQILSKIIEERKRQGKTQADIARELRISVPAWSDIETGKNRLSLPFALFLMKLLNIEAFQKFTGDKSEVDNFVGKLLNTKDSLIELQRELIETAKAIRVLTSQPKDTKPENRNVQINLKATAEEKTEIVSYATEKNLPLIEAYIELVRKEKEK